MNESIDYRQSLAQTIARRATPALAAAGLLMGTPAQAATFEPADVDDLIDAVNTANSNGQADIIELNGQTFTLTAIHSGEDGLPRITSNITIRNGTIARDTSVSTPDFRPLYVRNGSLTLENTTISGGVAGNGGCIYARSGDLTLRDSSVLSCTANTHGGGIYSRPFTELDLINSTVSDNTAGNRGGGIYSRTGEVTLINSTVSGNSASSGGGISAFVNYSTRLINTTVAGNSANNQGSGIFNYRGGDATLTNSLIVNNEGADNCVADDGATITSVGGTLDDDGSCTGNAVVAAGTYLADLDDNGGPTLTHALLEGNPAIDGGDQTRCDNNSITTDQRGEVRPINGDDVPGAICDVGAFELRVPLTDCTRDAIQAEIDAGQTKIIFDCPAPYVIPVGLPLTISGGQSVTINGSNRDRDNPADNIILDATNSPANGNRNSRIAVVTGSGSALTFTDITITGGQALQRGATRTGDQGGAIRADGNTSLSLIRTTATGNRANERGGAIHSLGVVSINDSTLSDNYADIGGAVSIDGRQSGTASLSLVNSTVSGNITGRPGSGGVRPVYYLAPAALFAYGDMSIEHSTVTNNTARYDYDYSRATVLVDGSTLTITNSIIAGNDDAQACFNSGNLNGLNIISDNSCGGSNVNNDDPLLGPLADNGGPTQTHALLSGSPALDSAEDCTLTDDQRGETRPFDIPMASDGTDECDIGSFERQADAGTIQFAMADFSVGEAGSPGQITLNRSGGDGAASVDVSITGGTATDGGTDFDGSAFPLTINFAPGETSQTIDIPVNDDNIHEDDETITFALSNIVNADTGAQASSTLTILDDDPLPTVTLSVMDTPIDESVGAATIIATLSNPSESDITVNLSTMLDPGTAEATDFTLIGNPIVVTAGHTTGTATLTGNDDTTDEPDETVNVDIDTVVNAAEATPQQITVIIEDDDAPPTVSFTAASARVPENAGAGNVAAFTLSEPSAFDVTVSFAVAGGTATNGTDYTIDTASPVTIPAGSTTANIATTIVDDVNAEPNETVIVNLSSASNATPVAPTTFTGTIVDNDATEDDDEEGSESEDDCDSFGEYISFCIGTGAITPRDGAVLLFFGLVALWRRKAQSS